MKFVKRKQTDRAKWISKLDREFSIFIRKRGEKNGFCTCFTCGKIAEIKEMQCGHYHSRKLLGTRWNEKNCQIQCVACNIYREGNKPVFTMELIKKYGAQILDELNIKARARSKYEIIDLKLLYEHYKFLNNTGAR